MADAAAIKAVLSVGNDPQAGVLLASAQVYMDDTSQENYLPSNMNESGVAYSIGSIASSCFPLV